MGDDFAAKRAALARPVNEPDLIQQAACCHCGDEATITLYDCFDENTGALKLYAASEISKYNNHGVATGFIKAGFKLDRGYGYCSACYMGIKKNMERQASAEVAKAWAWLIEQWDKVSPNTADPQSDTYLEICNRQAKESGNIDAIPPTCRLDHVWGGD